MAILRLGDYSLRLDLPGADAELAQADADCAWQFFVALARRPLLLGWPPAGELSAASARAEVEALAAGLEAVLAGPTAPPGSRACTPYGDFLARTLAFVLGPFLHKWRGEIGDRASTQAFSADLARVQDFLREACHEMARAHGFPDIVGERPPGLEAAWQMEPGA